MAERMRSQNPEDVLISLAIFPCRFTDSARILGELSYTLSLPVHTDRMIMAMVSE